MNRLSTTYFVLGILGLFLLGNIGLIGCGGKASVVEQRVEEPIFLYEVYIHGINPQVITSRIYEDGYVITSFDEVYSGKEKTIKGDFIAKSRVGALAAFYVSEGFFQIEPLSLPAIYGGEVVTITFNHDARSHTLKFLKGTKLPHSLEKCWNQLHALVEPLLEH